MREPLGSRELEQPACGGRVARTDDLRTDAAARLQQLAPFDQRAQDQVRERGVIEQQLAQLLARNRDVAHRPGHDRGDEHRLPAQKVDLPEKSWSGMANDLVPVAVQYRGFALDDRDERVGRITDLIQLLAHLGCVLLAVPGEHLDLRARQYSEPPEPPGHQHGRSSHEKPSRLGEVGARRMRNRHDTRRTMGAIGERRRSP